MSGRRQVLIAAGVGVLITVVFFFLLLLPKLNQISETQDDIDQARRAETELTADLNRLREVQRDAPETRARLARVADLLPSSPELPSFIRLLQQAADREGIDLQSIAPSPPGELDQNVQQMTVSVLIEGSFRRTEGFLARLENLDRLIEVTSVAITPTTDELSGQTVLSTTLSLRMFVAVEA